MEPMRPKHYVYLVKRWKPMAALVLSMRLRLMSGLALVLLAIIVLFSVTLVITNPGLVLLYAVCGALLLGGGWIWLTGTGRRWVWGVTMSAVGAVGLVVVTWTFLTRGLNDRRLVFLALASVAYVAVVGVVSRDYW